MAELNDMDLKIRVDTQGAEQNINSLNDKLEETVDTLEDVSDAADGGVGSLSGLGNAFEGVFSSAIDQGSKLGGTLGDTFKSIKQAIPIVKQVNNTAIAGLTGVKKAIAATGIGLLIVAVSTLITHWQDFLKIIGVSKEQFEGFKTKAIGVLGDIVAGFVGVGNVVVQYLLTPIRTTIQAFKGLGTVIKDVFTGNWKDIAKDAKEAFQGIGDAFKKGFDIKGNFEAGKAAGQQFVAGISSAVARSKETEDIGIETAYTLTKGLEEGSKDSKSKKAAAAAGKNIGKEVSKYASKEFLDAYQKELQDRASLRELALRAFDTKPTPSADEANVEEESVKDYLKRLQERKDVLYKYQKELLELEILPAREKNAKLYDLEQQRLDDRKAYLEGLLSLELEDSDKRREIEEQLQDLESQRTILVRKNAEQRKKDLQDDLKMYAEMAEGIASIFGTVAEAEEDRIKRELDSGKISKEAAEEQFKTVKAWQISQAVINTIAGSIGAFLQASAAYPAPYGQILGAITAASVLAEGIAQVNKIRNTNFGDSSVKGGSPSVTSSPSVTPLQVGSDIQANPVTLANSQAPADQRVYILESDLQESDKRVEIRESNSTF